MSDVLPEARAHQLAAALVAESNAKDHAAATIKAAQGGVVNAGASGPSDPPSNDQMRAWALQQATMDGHGGLRPSGEPRHAFVVVTPSGPRVVHAAQPPVNVVYGPGEAAGFEAAWQRQVRAEQDAILVAAFGEAACRDAGIL